MPGPTSAQAAAQVLAEREIEDAQTKGAPKTNRYSPIGAERVETEGPLRLATLIPRDAECAQTAASSRGRDMDATSAEPL